ncbi:MAG: O-antigen ligase family protein [Holophagales bacterium]|nr:O-antigen ligase family protein [Holophagales bacterium]
MSAGLRAAAGPGRRGDWPAPETTGGGAGSARGGDGPPCLGGRLLRRSAARPGGWMKQASCLAALERPLRLAVFAGIALLLLTPFVVTTSTIFPFVVGKALWSRSIIEVVFALWAVLALVDSRYRPVGSRLLGLLAAGFAVSLVSAAFGVSPMRSVWSTYERMQGLVDAAHWLALAVVLVSVLRTRAAWRMLLGGVAATGAVLALAVVALAHDVDVPFYGALPELDPPRLGGPLGNPTFLSACLLVSLMAALGLAVRALLAARVDASGGAVAASRAAGARGSTAPRPASARERKAWQRRARAAERLAPQRPRRPAGPPWVAVALWGTAAALALWAMALAGSVGGFVGLFASLGFLAVAGALRARGRLRTVAAVALVALLGFAAAAGLRATAGDRSAVYLPEHPVARYVLSTHVTRPGVQSRLAAWEAGLEGFAERPALGFGPENFIDVFGLYASGYGAFAEPHDRAHGKLVEVAATTGVAGVAAWLAMWSLALVTIWRAARRLEAAERALVLFLGAGLVGHLVQAQFLFDTPVSSLQAAMLLAFAAGLEGAAFADSRRPRLPGWLRDRWRALWGLKLARVALAVAALGAAVAGLSVHRVIHAAAGVEHVSDASRPLEVLAGGIGGFPPLGDVHRRLLFDGIGREWAEIRAADGGRARRLLELAAREAAEAERTRTAEWRLHLGAARLFAVAATTDPAYEGEAERFLASSRALAPDRAVFLPPLRPPESLSGARRADGRYELRWRWPESAGYVAIEESGDGVPRRFVLHAYDPAQTSFVLPEGREPGVLRYRIKACRYPGRCSANVEWPAAGEGRDG